MYLKPKGFSLVTDGWGVETREDSYTCKHCQKVCFVKPRTDPNEFWCRGCMAPICPRCANHECEHFERKLERAEKDHVLRGLGCADFERRIAQR